MSKEQAGLRAQSPRLDPAIRATSSQSSVTYHLAVPSTAPRVRSLSASIEGESPNAAVTSFGSPDRVYQGVSFPVPERSQQFLSSSKEESATRSEGTPSSEPQVQASIADLATDIPSLLQYNQSFEFNFPPRRFFSQPSFPTMVDPQKLSQADKEQLIAALQTRRVNTLLELRRVERLFAQIGTPDLTEPMTLAWQYYVNSNQLLNELRSLTKNYPFSSSCLDDAKQRVYQDPASNRSWNYCWLVLTKIHNDQLVPIHAQAQAALPSMWGNREPTPEAVARLANAFITEWSWALGQMLRNWDVPPTI